MRARHYPHMQHLTVAEQKTLTRLHNAGFSPYGYVGIDRDGSVFCHDCLNKLEASLKTAQKMTVTEYENQYTVSTDSLEMKYIKHPIQISSGEVTYCEENDGEYCDFCERRFCDMA